MKGRPAGNPDCRVRAGVRPGTHRSVSAVRACRRSRHARCCTRGGHGLLSAIALALIGCFLTVVGATLAPIVGMWFPRYSAIRIGNSDGVRPPRLLAGALHVASVWLPGAALVGLVAAPELVQLGLSGIGYVPGFILRMVADGGVLTTLASSLNDAGATIQGLPAYCIPRRIWRAVGVRWSAGRSTCLPRGDTTVRYPPTRLTLRSNVFSQ